ncbi:MAG TPA: TIGR02710 family CRISPR-associated CARF protein [Smithellaceae bacterium]|nr:TIGR02710 family CRISPR-associated CARF protein [Smithellaceae bacterium]
MKKVMILSLGGSAEPVINSIKKGKADYYYFFCSSGPKGSERLIDAPGDPCGDTRKAKCPKCKEEFYTGNPRGAAIAFQTGLAKEHYEAITVADPDDLTECYTSLLATAKRIKERFGDSCTVVANYTGGTKTMSVALALMGILNESWQISINKGPRNDLIKVKVGDTPVAVDKWRLYSEHQLIIARKAIHRYDYAHAESVLSDILVHPLDKQTANDIQNAVNVCRAFDLWDKFRHQDALDLLTTCKANFPELIIAIKKILGQQRTVSGYELVGDLLNNADRRAYRGYFDDAVGRLYRATELFAQIRLKTSHGLDSGKMKLNDLPAGLRPKYHNRVREDNRLIFGLRDDYALLADLNDPVGAAFEMKNKQLTDTLKKRNTSIFAHGSNPLSAADYRKVNENLAGFITDASASANINYCIPQLPQDNIV